MKERNNKIKDESNRYLSTSTTISMTSININIPTTAPPPAPPNTTGDKPVSPEMKKKRGKTKTKIFMRRERGGRRELMG